MASTNATVDEMTEQNDEESKRERIDLEAVDPNTKVTLVLQIPAGLKLAILKAGESNNISGTKFARNVLAERVEYVIPAEFEQRERKHKYASKEEAQKAQKERQLDNRKTVLAMLKLIEAGAIDENLLEQAKAQVEVKTRARKSE